MTAPDLILFKGDWQPYEDQIYEAYLDTIVRSGIQFRGRRVSAQFRPETKGKGFAFWHVISESLPANKREDERVPDIRRCERIRWIAWVIEHAGEPGFLCWEADRKGAKHIVIWAEAHDYAVVLAARSDYYMLKTGYVVDQAHRKQSFRREYDAFIKAQKG